MLRVMSGRGGIEKIKFLRFNLSGLAVKRPATGRRFMRL